MRHEPAGARRFKGEGEEGADAEEDDMVPGHPVIVIANRRRSMAAWLRGAGGLLALVAAAPALGAEGDPSSQPTPAERMAAFRRMVDPPVVLRRAGAEEVEVVLDQAYSSPGGAKLLADVYRPRGLAAGARLPAVLLLHGGVPDEVPYRPKDWGVYRSWGRLLGASGLVGIAFNQRVSSPDPKLALARQDLEAMLGWLRDNAGSLHVDPDRVCLASFSAGGPLLASFISSPRTSVRCLVAFYSYLDVRQSEQHRAFMRPAELEAFSPAAQLAAGAARMPPLLVARGGKDDVGTVLASEDRFIAEAIRTNAPVEILNHPTAPHGFDNRLDDARSRAIVSRAVAFMREALGLEAS